MRVIKVLSLGIVALVVLVAAVFFGARFADGPIAMFPGGPLRSGTMVTEPVADWSFAQQVAEIELQLADEDSSRTTWIVVSEGAAFIPCSLGFPPNKQWHLRADEDGRAILRIEGRKYPVQLRRLPDSSERADLKALAETKYGGLPPTDAGVWFFAVDPRSN